MKITDLFPALIALLEILPDKKNGILSKLRKYIKVISEEKNIKDAYKKIAEDKALMIRAQNKFADILSSEIDCVDKHSARSRDIVLLNKSNTNTRANLMVMAAVLGITFCTGVLCIYKNDLPGEVIAVISTMSGIFGSCLKDAYSFEFGSSRGSKEKYSDILKNMEK